MIKFFSGIDMDELRGEIKNMKVDKDFDNTSSMVTTF